MNSAFSSVVPVDVRKSVNDEENREETSYLQTRHKEIRKWYGTQPSLKEKWMLITFMSRRFGKFPLFWQDLKEWDHWKEVESLYNEAQSSTADQSRPSERRNRWADASSRLKRSRWDADRRYIQPGEQC